MAISKGRLPDELRTVTLPNVGWNIVLMSLIWHHDEIGDDCPNMKLVHDNIANQIGLPPNTRFPGVKPDSSEMGIDADQTRDEVAKILETIAKDGLPGPRGLDVALDAIESLYKT